MESVETKPVVKKPKVVAEVDPKYRNSMLYALRSVFTILFGFLVLCSFLLAFASQVIVLPFTVFLSSAQRSVLLGQVFRFWAGFCVVKLNPMWSVEVKRKRTQPAPRGTIVMCNHLSNCDPFLLCWALWPWETKYISKGSLFNIPFGGWAMRLAGDIPIHFTSDKGGWGIKKGTIALMMENCKKLLARGQSIAVFPEGQRSPDGELAPFKDGTFSLAIETGSDVLPVAMAGPERMWPTGSWQINPGVCQVAIGEPISSKGYDVEGLKARVRQEISDLKAKLKPTKFA